MKNKKFIIGFTCLIALLCAFYLSFTYLSRQVQSDAEKYAVKKTGFEDPAAKQKYLDSVWNEPVFNFLGAEFTYKEIKEKELKLGLDLKGGLHLVLEISPDELVKKLAGRDATPELLEALDKASKGNDFVESFYEEYRKLTDEPLSQIFANVNNKEYVTLESTDRETLAYLEQEVEDALGRTLEILRNRIDQYGVASPNIQRLPGTQRIQVELSGIDNAERVKSLLRGLAKLEFWEVWDIASLQPVLLAMNERWMSLYGEKASVPDLSDSLELALADSTLPENAASPMLELLQANYGLVYSLRDTAEINRMLNDQHIKNLKPRDLVFKWQAKPEVALSGDYLLELYPLKPTGHNAPALTGAVIVDARQDFDNGAPAISMTMNGTGAQQWRKITASSIGSQIAIALDDKVYSAPVVQSEIPNGHSSITGDFTIDEAKDLANILKSGKMPATVNIVEEAVVGPTLGQEAISQGLISIIAGLALVALFMTAYYGKGGNIANVALLINVVFILGILAQFGASLTLPGIAGIVLAIGMSVDANVLIFERIREELRHDKSLGLAVKNGYDKAFSSIIDSNVTTFLVGLILYTFGSGGIKGFAIVLMIGIVCSVFTAVFITRLFLEPMARKGSIGQGSFNTFLSKSITGSVNFDFFRFRKYAYVLSAAVIIVGIGLSAMFGFYRQGVDFKGGHSFVVKFDQPVKAQEVRSSLSDAFGESSLEVKTYNNPSQLRITTSYMIDDHTEHADKMVRSALETGLQGISDKNPEVIGYSKVGASIADDVKDAAQTVILAALFIIFLYIIVRFSRWQYGLGAVVALMHDVLMIFAFYGIAGALGLHLEIDQAFIAAVLTVIGYSINDTVVIFDRIREFSGKVTGKEQFAKIINPAINNTLTRTIVTSVTVLIVTVILLFFAGEVLRGFAFALLIGVVVGTYSSIFIAAPVAADSMTSRKSIGRSIKPAHKAA